MRTDVPARPVSAPDLMNGQMRSKLQFEPGSDFVDPRFAPDFDAGAWPLCNGAAAPPPGASDLYERRCLDFLASYYRLNVLNRQLLEARQQSARKEKIRSILSALNKAAKALEKLEDRYAPIGFFGEPVMDGVFYRDLAF